MVLISFVTTPPLKPAPSDLSSRQAMLVLPASSQKVKSVGWAGGGFGLCGLCAPTTGRLNNFRKLSVGGSFLRNFPSITHTEKVLDAAIAQIWLA